MRLKNFAMLVVLAGALGMSGLYWACRGSGDAPRSEPAVAKVPEPTPEPPPPPPPVAQPTGGGSAESHDDLAARPHDAEVLAWKDRTISGDKVKDASKGKPYKVNLYREGGAKNVNRAKVDLDRDDKWDEKYTFEDGKITLQRAPADDERYSETYHWSGTGWAKAR